MIRSDRNVKFIVQNTGVLFLPNSRSQLEDEKYIQKKKLNSVISYRKKRKNFKGRIYLTIDQSGLTETFLVLSNDYSK